MSDTQPSTQQEQLDQLWGLWGWSAKSAAEAWGSKVKHIATVKLHSRSACVSWWAVPLSCATWPPRAPPRPPAQQGRKFLNIQVITLIDTCFLLKPGTEQYKAGISKSSNSAKHTEAWWILVPNQTQQGRSSLLIDYAEAWHWTARLTFLDQYCTVLCITEWCDTSQIWSHITARHLTTRSRAAKFKCASNPQWATHMHLGLVRHVCL